MPTTPHNRDFRRGRRLLEAICVEAHDASATLEMMREVLDGRLASALRLLADSSEEYRRAVTVLQRVGRAKTVEGARSAAREYLVAIGRQD